MKRIFLLILLTPPFYTFGQDDLGQLEKCQWLVGHWIGEGFGLELEEIWTEPVGGIMVGMFRAHKEGKLQFMELVTLSEDEDSFVMKVKHFNSDLTGWEEKDDYLVFTGKEISENVIRMQGLVIERLDGDHIKMEVDVKKGDSIATEVLSFRRK